MTTTCLQIDGAATCVDEEILLARYEVTLAIQCVGVQTRLALGDELDALEIDVSLRERRTKSDLVAILLFLAAV